MIIERKFHSKMGYVQLKTQDKINIENLENFDIHLKLS